MLHQITLLAKQYFRGQGFGFVPEWVAAQYSQTGGLKAEKTFSAPVPMGFLRGRSTKECRWPHKG